MIKIKNIFFTIISCLYFLCVFSEEIPQDLKKIIDKGTLEVAMYAEDVPPFFMHFKTGEFKGIDVEIATDIAKRLGVKLKINRDATTFDMLSELLINGKVDMVISIFSQTLKRAKTIRFSKPYIMLHPALIINRLKSAKYKKGAKTTVYLNNPELTIGVIEGTSYVGFAKEEYPNANFKLYKDWSSISKDVVKGEIIAAYYDNIEIQNWSNENPDASIYLQTVIRKDKFDPIAIGLNYKDTHLLSWVNLYFDIINNDGTMKYLKNKYLESDKWKKL